MLPASPSPCWVWDKQLWIAINCSSAFGTVGHGTVHVGWLHQQVWGCRAGTVNVGRLSVRRVGLEAALYTMYVYCELSLCALSQLSQSSLLPWNNTFSKQIQHLGFPGWKKKKALGMYKKVHEFDVRLDKMLILCIS